MSEDKNFPTEQQSPEQCPEHSHVHTHDHEQNHIHMHEHVDADGSVYIYCCDDSDDDGYNPEHYHVDELGNLYSHVHDHGDKKHEHEHIDSSGNLYTHSHDAEGQGHSHEEGECEAHLHSHKQTKAVINRLSRAIGHLESVKRMVENGRDCTEVLIQLAAVRSALSSTAKVILKDHLEHCINEAGSNNPDQFKALNDAIDRFL